MTATILSTAYGANGGTGKGKYQGYRTPGRGGKAEGTIHLSAGQTIHIYLGEAGGYWSTNRTFGGGGGQIDWDRAWFPDEDNGQTDRYHVFGRGGGATYVTVDAWTMDQAGEAAHDYTDAEKAQNDAAAEVAKNHVILLAGGGGGMGESGGTAGGGGLEGQGPVANRYYAGGFPPYSNAFSYDATVGGTTPTNGRALTYDERVNAKVYPATQTRAGFGYHYTILGELYDANPANRDPVSLLFDDGQARNYGSFFYGANGITCSGAGGGGWFGGGTDYAFSGGGGSSFVNTSVTIDGKQVEVKDADYEVGGNMKYDSTNSAPYLINGRVLIHMVGTTPKMKTIMMEAQNEDISSSHVDDADVYGQKAYLNKGQDVASTTIAYTAITYYNMGDLMTVNPVWEYSTMLSPTDRDWNDSVAKSIDSRLSVSVANTNLGVPNPGDKYYNADYPGWYAVKSVMTITNPVNTMYSTERLTKYYFRCKGIASYTLSSGTKTMYDKGERGELAIDYNIYINHEGVHVYSDRNIINGTPTSTVDDTIAATAGRSASTWQYPHMALTDVNNINTILIQFSSHGFNTSDSISYDASYADSLGITGSGNQYSYIFKAKSKNSVSTANWEKFLQSITYTTYDAATFTSTGVSGGVTIFWYADENLWENNMFYDSSSGHFYACINTGNSITWGEARNRALSMYNSALDCYGYLAHITSQSEQDYLYTLMDKSTQGWLGATRKVSGNEWDWYWRDGPANETSEPFFRQNADGTYGTLLWGYENWDSKTEPNNSGGVEWCMHYYGSNRGVWNDYIDSNGAVTSFIVEWSKDGLVGNDHSVSDTDVIGTQIEYTLTEDTMSGYSDVVEKRSDYVFVLTNKYSPATVDVTIVKKWDDDNDRDGMRPESVDIVLNGSDGKLYTGTLSTENGYTCVFQSVPKYHDGGTLINYTIAEEKIPGYTTTIAKDASGYKFTLTNAKTIDTVTKTVSKVWDDNNNQDGLRPTAITVILTGDDGSRRVKSVTAAENWTVTFENLPKNQNHGQNIQYTVSEAFVFGYTEAITQNGDNYTITNTHTPASSEFFVTKIWKDNGNNDGMRPDEITITAHGSDGRSYTEKLNADNQWSVMFSNLPKYADGKVIEYSLTEESVPGYTSSITRNGKSFVLINTHVDETKNITITKAWNDGNNQDGLRPKTITAVVNGSDGSARFVQLFEGQNWATNLNNLPKYKNGTEIQYTVKENAIPGYETEIKQTGDSYAITNSHTPAVVTVSAVKVWDDANNQDGIRPSLIQVTLTGSDGSVRNAAITKNDGWTYQFKNLPKYKNGMKIDYTLQEANSNPYTYEIVKGSDEYSFTITNNYVPAVVNVPITTVWDDDDNRDGIRAKETAITLHGSNGKVYQRIVTGKDDFATAFEDVPKFFDEGREVVYTVTQNEMNGYTANIANTDKYTFQITNTHEPERLAKTVTKVWDDNNNQDGLRPNTLRIALTGTDGTYIEKSLSTANNWTETFDGLYKYFKEGTPIQYTIDEEAVGGYEKGISEKDNLITITNTHAPEKLDLIVNVVWNDANNQDGYRPDAATIHMSGTDGTQDAKDFTKDSSWSSIVFKDLDHYKDGNEIKYTVAEDEIPQYTTSIAVNGNVVTVTNTHIPEITLRNISVVWEDNNDQDGIRPDAVNIKLKGNDKLVDSSELNEDVKWKHSFTKLPVRENGNEISYTAEENEIPGYTTTIEKTDTGYVFTNTHIPETVTVTVDKVWEDGENQDGLRPDSIDVILTGSDGNTYNATISEKDNWTYIFANLPKYFNDGTLVEYSLQEVETDGYAGTVTKGTDGYTFTIKNDHTPAVVDIPVTKVWNDDEDRDGLRPNSIHVTLTGSDGSTYKKDLEKDSGYSTIFTSLPKYHNGELISYSLAETPVEGYETDIQAAESGYGFTITNTHEVSKKTIKVSKVWDDAENQDGIRPDSVTVTLTGSNNSKYTAKLNKENNWTYTFEGLFCKADGATIKYEVSEKDVAGYTPSIKETEGGFIITNAHKPETVTINIVKNWNDSQNADNIRPDAISITLTGSDNSSRSITLNKAGDYKTAVDSLPKFHEGKQITYTVTETPVDGYTSSVQASADGYSFVVINTHTPEVHQEKKETPTTPKFEIKAEPSTTIIQTTNKPTGVSFFDSLLG